MKRKIIREITLISLPIIFIAGAAWLFAGNGRTLLPAKFDNGPAWLEFEPFKPVKVSAADVYQGVDYEVATAVSMKGKLRVPTVLKPYAIMQVWTNNYRIIYRIGKKWKRAAILPGDATPISQGFDLSSGTQTLNLHLETVPTNAQEIRFRGKFTEFHEYSGVLPPGWTPPKNYVKIGKFHNFTVESKPFDVLVQAPDQQRPRPTASRETGVSVVKASYDASMGEGIRLQLWRAPKFGKPESVMAASLLSLKLLDGQGHPLDICEANGSPTYGNSNMAFTNREGLNIPDTDFVVVPPSGLQPGRATLWRLEEISRPVHARSRDFRSATLAGYR